nr:importin-5-like [Ipomoea batatas]
MMLFELLFCLAGRSWVVLLVFLGMIGFVLRVLGGMVWAASGGWDQWLNDKNFIWDPGRILILLIKHLSNPFLSLSPYIPGIYPCTTKLTSSIAFGITISFVLLGVAEALSRLNVVIGHQNALQPEHIMAYDDVVSAPGESLLVV